MIDNGTVMVQRKIDIHLKHVLRKVTVPLAYSLLVYARIDGDKTR